MVDKWVPHYCTLDIEWVTIMGVLNLNSMIHTSIGINVPIMVPIIYEKRF